MENTKKMYLVPYQYGGEDGTPQNDVFNKDQAELPAPVERKVNSIRKYAAERQVKLLQIVLKIASYGGYDSNGTITTSSGQHVDIVPLLLYAASPGRSVKGLQDFVDLLVKAGVTPDLIINTSLREELETRMKRFQTRSIGTQVTRIKPRQRQQPTDSQSMEAETHGVKRKRNNDLEPHEVPLPSGEKWDVDDSDVEDDGG